MLAQNKEEVEEKQKAREEEKKEGKDQRNLYLAREGMVREGTQVRPQEKRIIWEFSQHGWVRLPNSQNFCYPNQSPKETIKTP